MKFSKTIAVFIAIMLQTAVAIPAGFFALSASTKNRIPPDTYIENLEIGGMGREKAVRVLEEYYGSMLKDKELSIIYKGKEVLKIGYPEIDVYVNCAATINSVYSTKVGQQITNLAREYFYPRKPTTYFPSVSINKVKLEDKLKELARKIDTEPVNADVYAESGTLVKVPEIDGFKLNIDKACKKIADEFADRFATSVELSCNSGEIEVIKPELTLEDMEGIDEILSEYSTVIASPRVKNSVSIASDSIDKVLVRPIDEDKNSGACEFSFNRCLGMNSSLPAKEDEGYDQVASTLYAAVLAAGIDHGGITCVHHKIPVDYIEPGLDVCVNKDSNDFTFINTLRHSIAILARIKDNRLTVSIAGKRDDASVRYEIKTDIVQRFAPPVISIEDVRIAPGKRELVDPGREGIKVNIYRYMLKNGAIAKRELIGTNTYDAIESIVHIGPGTSWERDTTPYK